MKYSVSFLSVILFRFHTTCVFVVFTAAVLLCTGSPVVAWNPQPEPPADSWKVEGFIDMTALEIMPTGTANPFGVDEAIIGDSEVDFHVGVIATFTAPDHDGDLKPDDGFYTATTRFFDVFIGNTHWDETMFSRDLGFQVQGRLVTGVRGVVCGTDHSQPDLEFMFPASPGAWLAIDERDGNNLGTISGSYVLRDGVVPERSDFPWQLFVPAVLENLQSKMMAVE